MNIFVLAIDLSNAGTHFFPPLFLLRTFSLEGSPLQLTSGPLLGKINVS
jgi:hypothetical protein